MTKLPFSVAHLANEALLAETRKLAAVERQSTAQLIAALAEIDARRLYLGEGCSSLFTWCTQVLHLSEHAAYARIEAARAARRFPAILHLLADGAIHLTAVCLLAPHLTPDNHEELLAGARHKSRCDVERIVAALRPQPAVPASVRKLPEPRQPDVPPTALVRSPVDVARDEPVKAMPPIAPSSRPVLKPLAPERYKVQFTVSRETFEKLRRVQDLLRHSIPDGDVAVVFDRALTLLLEDVERTKLAATERPAAEKTAVRRSRSIAAAVRREVWKRYGGRCAFVGTTGRCAETGFLEFHHVVPYAAGGATDAANLQLRCRAHNGYEAEQYFGPSELRESRAAYGAPRAGTTRSGPS